jgi:glutamyl-tRNA reductase
MDLVLVGTSHHHAPVELRERVALDRERAASLARELGEAVCLSTCNRTELYVAAEDGDDAEARAASALASLEPQVEHVLYRLRDHAAALHLFRVAAGLDSLVPGEGEILGQVRAAHESGTPGLVLDRVFRQALHAGRKVRAQTAIGESPASVSSAAAALAEQVFGDLKGSRILLVGAGKVGDHAARNLRTRGAEISLVATSTTDRAELEAELARADVVVSSTSSPGIVLDAATVDRARRGRRLLLIDLAVPRDLDPAIHELDGCYLYDIDDLQAIVAETIVGRRGEAARAEAIRAAELRKAEGLLGRLDDGERRAVESMTAQIVNKLLHLPTVRMKQAAVSADGVIYAEAVRHLFGLGEDER